MKKRMSRETFTRISLLALSALIITGTLVAGRLIQENKEYNEKTAEGENFDIADLASNPAKGSAEGGIIANDGTQPTAEEKKVTQQAENNTDAVAENDAETATVSEVLQAAGSIDFSKLIWPVSSTDIVMGYSYNTQPVFSQTFNEYRSDHTGVDIAAAAGESVKCVYDGKVSAIYDDPKLGTTVKVDHGNNIFTEYANLAKDVSVTLNQTVKAGSELGKVGGTAAYESAEAPHLHFALILDGNYVNIAEYMNF